MTKLLQIGQSTKDEIGAKRYGHVACTLGGVNYESTAHTLKGGSGCVRGSSARGATNPLFKHQFFILVGDARAKAAMEYADGCVGQPYKIGMVPSKNQGGDCSGFVSGIICVAKGMPIKRLFSTAEWLTRFDDADLAFSKGLGGGVMPGRSLTGVGVVDRPYPGKIFKNPHFNSDHVAWIQARLNFALHTHLSVDRDYGDDTAKLVGRFQRAHHLEDDGKVGKKTWNALNQIR